jgi:hypothetical protein
VGSIGTRQAAPSLGGGQRTLGLAVPLSRPSLSLALAPEHGSPGERERRALEPGLPQG